MMTASGCGPVDLVKVVPSGLSGPALTDVEKTDVYDHHDQVVPNHIMPACSGTFPLSLEFMIDVGASFPGVLLRALFLVLD
jgi:hypothetical protein